MTAVFFHIACFPMLYSVALSPAKRMHTPAPGGGSSSGSGPAPVKQCQAVNKFSNVCSGSARPGPVRVLILWLSEDPALNSSCNTGKRSNWGIFYIINSGEQPSHSPSPLPLHFHSLYSHSHTFLLPNLFFFLPLPYILWICFHPFCPGGFVFLSTDFSASLENHEFE